MTKAVRQNKREKNRSAPDGPRTRAVDPEFWEDVFSQTVYDNRERVVVVEILDDLGDQELVRGKWLRSLVPQTKHDRTEIELTYEHYAWDAPERLTHYIKDPTRVWVLERPDRTVAALEFETREEGKVIVRFVDQRV